MGKSINKFIVRLSDQSAFRPQLAVSVVPNKEQKKTFEVRLVNPNTKEVVFKEEFKAKGKDEMSCFVEALNHGKVMLARPEVQILQYSLEYKEQLFIPQGRRGKMKLKTKDSEEAIAERQAAKEREAEAAVTGNDDLPEFVEEDVEIPEEPVVEASEDNSVLSTHLKELEELLVKKSSKNKKEKKTKNKVEAKETKNTKKEPKVSAKKAKVVAKPAKNKKKAVKKAAPKKKDKNKKKKK